MTNLTTSTLWTSTHSALTAGHWSRARALLDELGTRRDNRDLLSSAASYGCPEHLQGVIQDRIDLVNSHA